MDGDRSAARKLTAAFFLIDAAAFSNRFRSEGCIFNLLIVFLSGADPLQLNLVFALLPELPP